MFIVEYQGCSLVLIVCRMEHHGFHINMNMPKGEEEGMFVLGYWATERDAPHVAYIPPGTDICEASPCGSAAFYMDFDGGGGGGG